MTSISFELNPSARNRIAAFIERQKARRLSVLKDTLIDGILQLHAPRRFRLLEAIGTRNRFVMYLLGIDVTSLRQKNLSQLWTVIIDGLTRRCFTTRV